MIAFSIFPFFYDLLFLCSFQTEHRVICSCEAQQWSQLILKRSHGLEILYRFSDTKRWSCICIVWFHLFRKKTQVCLGLRLSWVYFGPFGSRPCPFSLAVIIHHCLNNSHRLSLVGLLLLKAFVPKLVKFGDGFRKSIPSIPTAARKLWPNY